MLSVSSAECSLNSLHELTTFDQVQIPFDQNCGSFILLQTKSTEKVDLELKVNFSRKLKNSVSVSSFSSSFDGPNWTEFIIIDRIYPWTTIFLR